MAPAGTTCGWVQGRFLWSVILVSIVLRVGGAIYLGNMVEEVPGTQDQISYDALAQNVVAGEGFVFDDYWYPFTPPKTPTAHWSFLYTSYLAGIYFVAGHHPLIARLIQAVLVGALMPWLVYRIGGGRLARQWGWWGRRGSRCTSIWCTIAGR